MGNHPITVFYLDISESTVKQAQSPGVQEKASNEDTDAEFLLYN